MLKSEVIMASDVHNIQLCNLKKLIGKHSLFLISNIVGL